MIPPHLPSTEITAPDGARATIALDGAHVVSWTPAGSQENRLFVSAATEFGPGAAIRGGIPIVFPQFGAFGPLRQHGFARRCRWELVSSPATSPGHATLRLAESNATRAEWPHSFLARLDVDVQAQTLTVQLTVENTGSETFEFTAAFHPYFAVSRAFATRVDGLEGCQYRDSLRNGGTFEEIDATLAITGPLDRIYYKAPNRLVIVDGDRTLTIEKEGFSEAVVWNPGIEGTSSRTDFVVGDEHAMLCVEAAVIQQPVRLAPGATWSGTQRMTTG